MNIKYTFLYFFAQVNIFALQFAHSIQQICSTWVRIILIFFTLFNIIIFPINCPFFDINHDFVSKVIRYTFIMSQFHTLLWNGDTYQKMSQNTHSTQIPDFLSNFDTLSATLSIYLFRHFPSLRDPLWTDLKAEPYLSRCMVVVGVLHCLQTAFTIAIVFKRVYFIVNGFTFTHAA